MQYILIMFSPTIILLSPVIFHFLIYSLRRDNSKPWEVDLCKKVKIGKETSNIKYVSIVELIKCQYWKLYLYFFPDRSLSTAGLELAILLLQPLECWDYKLEYTTPTFSWTFIRLCRAKGGLVATFSSICVTWRLCFYYKWTGILT